MFQMCHMCLPFPGMELPADATTAKKKLQKTATLQKLQKKCTRRRDGSQLAPTACDDCSHFGKATQESAAADQLQIYC